MKIFIAFVVGLVAILAMFAAMYAIVGAIFYFGLPVLGVEVTFMQSVVLAILIMVTGALFRGGSISGKQEKGDDALSE